jgi:pentatricopeptide repeat protein
MSAARPSVVVAALVQQGKFEEAEHYYRRSLAEKPGPAVENALRDVRRKLGRA